MLPEQEIEIIDMEIVQEPSYTYKLDIESGRIRGMVDDLDAVIQAVQKILWTERYSCVIYNSEYGVELERLIGQEYDYIKSDLERTITEALLTDNRILGIENFEIEKTGLNSLHASFTVNSTEGSVPVETEVMIV